MDASYILPLDSAETTLEVAGGKAANLARLARGGFPVPPGFVLSTAAYRTFVAANDLADRIAAIVQATANDPAAYETASQSIRRLFAEGTVPADVATAVASAYRDLAAEEPDLAVAVRSSATAEDLPEASFAGQQETYLNVRGEAAVLDAVKRCWSSLWTARAIAYRAHQGIDPAGVGLAVVVQRLVPAEVAGILFTVDPLSGARDVVVINAAWGLGEAIVSGQVTPDTVVVDKATGTVRAVTVGDKALMTAAALAGTAEVAVAADRRQQPALTPEQAAELARLGVAVEAAFGGPQDIEWAIAGGSAYLLQARPVTAIAGATARGSLDGPVPGDDAWPALGERPPQPYDLWTQSDMGERWPEPVTPLTWSIQPQLSLDYTLYSFRDVRAPYLRQTQWAKRFFGRVYLNEGALSRVCLEEYGIPLSMVSGAMGGWASEEQAGGRRLRVGRLLRALPAMLPVLLDRLRNEKRYPALFPRIDRSVRAFRRRDLSQASDRALWDELHDVWLARVGRAINLHGDVTSSSMMALPMLERLVERWYGRKEVAPELLTGIADLRQAEMVPALYGMAQQLRALGLASVVLDQPPAEALARLRATPEARPFLQALDRFLDDHGHRCAIEAEFLYPRWAEAPEQVLDALAAYLRAPDVNPLAAEARQRDRRATTLAAVERRLDPARRAIFRSVLARTEHLVRLRDNGQHYLVKLMLPLRHLFAALGERWAARGWLAQPSDVFFLAITEVEAVAKAGDPAAASRDLRATVAARRQAYEYWFTVKAPEVVDAQGRPVAPETADEGALRGIAASGGRAEGRARVIQRLEDAGQLQPGDILVTRATDPGWTPVFPLVSALVLEVGGQLSHGAIVAREYGLPAVVNVPDAMARIRDGQRITVDGTAGRVYLDDVAADTLEEVAGVG